MGFNTLSRSFPIVLLVSISGNVNAQDAMPTAKTILDLSQSDQAVFINRTLDLGLPQSRADQMTMLIINRSAVTLPLIEEKLEGALKSPSAPTGFVDTASEMIAYSGDEQALRAVSKLMALDESRFGRLVGRTLDNAANWRNPFTVAYRGFEIGDDALSWRIGAWAESSLSSAHGQRAWAEALLDKYGGMPDESVWTTDPIASRLKNGASPELRQSVTRFVTDAQTKRMRR